MQPAENNRDLILLDQIEQNPNATQASLAAQLGVAVGTVNWHLKRLINKGYVKVRRAERRKLRYLITPEGLALRTHLTIDFIHTSFSMFRQTHQKVVELLAKVRQAGFDQVCLEGDPEGGPDGLRDIYDVCRLTCLEQGVTVVDLPGVPVLEVRGFKVILHLEENNV
jgi:DNA-binding MarR family transcriptional regulator